MTREAGPSARDAVSCLSVSVRLLQYPDPKFKLVTRP
jgi:hypothetical protein